MPMYKSIEYSDNYSKTTGSFWQQHRDEPFLDSNDNIANIPGDNNNSASFKFKTKGQRAEQIMIAKKNNKIMVPLKYLKIFRRTLEISLINCEIDLVLTSSANCFVIYSPVENQLSTFIIADTKLYIPVVTLSTQDNAKLL